MVEITNLLYLEADNKNEVINSKDAVVKAIDAIPKNALSEDYQTICEKDSSDSKQLLGDDLADKVKKVKATHSMDQSISNKSLRLSSRNPTSLYSSSSKTSTSTTHSLNFQGRKKNFQRPQSTTRWNQKQQPQMKRN